MTDKDTPSQEPFGYLRQTSSKDNPPHGWAFHFSQGDVPIFTTPPDAAAQIEFWKNATSNASKMVAERNAEIDRLLKIEAAAVEVVNAPEWQGDEFYELLGKLLDAVRGE